MKTMTTARTRQHIQLSHYYRYILYLNQIPTMTYVRFIEFGWLTSRATLYTLITYIYSIFIGVYTSSNWSDSCEALEKMRSVELYI